MRKILINLSIVLITYTTMGQDYEQVSKKLNKYIKDNKAPGLQYLVMKNGEVLFEYNGGYADLENKNLVTNKTVFRIFSSTKIFTALAILQLVEKGKLNLDDRASKYLNNYTFKEEVTIKQLLSHTAGMPNPFPKWIHYEHEHEQFNNESFRDSLIQKHNKLKSKPGKKGKYENYGYILLGMIIETVSGQKYEEYVNEFILKKLDYSDPYIGFTIPPKNIYAKAYNRANILMKLIFKKLFGKELIGEKTNNWIALNNFYLNISSYGGLIANAQILANFVNNLYYKDDYSISKEIKQEMFTPVKLNSGKVNQGKVFGKKISLCFAWMKSDLNGVEYFLHPGNGGGYSMDMRLYPEKNLVTVIMMNRTGIPSDLNLLDKFDIYFVE